MTPAKARQVLIVGARPTGLVLALCISPYPYAFIFPQDEHERLLIDCLADVGVSVDRRPAISCGSLKAVLRSTGRCSARKDRKREVRESMITPNRAVDLVINRGRRNARRRAASIGVTEPC